MTIQGRRVPRRLTVALAAGVAILPAQELPSKPAYTYEVVSIHPAAPGQDGWGFSEGPHDGVRARNVTALQTLAVAYGVSEYQVVDLPGWARSERFDITYTPDRSESAVAGETTSEAVAGWVSRQRQRMQAVLRDRFSVVLHTETRELPLYELRVAKNGHKLNAAAHPQQHQSMNINNGRQVVAGTATMKAFAEVLAGILGRPVNDETGLDGAFDFKVYWTPYVTEAEQPVDSRLPSLFTALTEQLGLRLESKKGPVRVFVIDRIEKPSEN